MTRAKAQRGARQDRPGGLLNRRDALAGLAGAAALAARHGTAQASKGRADRLVVAAFPAIDVLVRDAAPAFEALHPGVKVDLVARELNDHHTAMTTALSTASHLPDVMALEIGYVGRFARGTALEDLSRQPFDASGCRERFVPFAFAQGTDAGGAVRAIPSDIGPGTLLYRADLLARAGLDEAALTRSWDGFVEAGARIRSATGARLVAHARDLKDIVIRTGIAPGDGLYYDAQSRAVATAPRFVRAFELARRVRQEQLDARVIVWTSDWAEGFRRGGIATQMSGAWMAGHLNKWLAPTTRGLWRAAQLPEGSYAAWGGTFYAIPRAAPAESKPLAWDFIRLMTLSRERQLAAFKSQDAFPSLLECFDDPFFDQPIEFLGGQAGRSVWREAARHIQAVRVHKQDAFAEEVVNAELDKVLLRGKDIPSALGDAQRLLQARALR